MIEIKFIFLIKILDKIGLKIYLDGRWLYKHSSNSEKRNMNINSKIMY